MTETSSSPSATNTVRLRSAVAAVVVALVFGGIAGFYIRGLHHFSAPQGSPLQPAANRPAASLPAGFTRLAPRSFGNWTLACVQGPKGGKQCDLVMPVIDGATKKTVLKLLVTRGPQGKPVLSVLTPPDVVLPEGLTLVPGSKPAIKIAFLRCGPGACQALLALDGATSAALGGADALQISYVGAGGHKVGYKVPTTGFSDGYAAWQTESPPLAQQPATP
jgi:invasion protein IalB